MEDASQHNSDLKSTSTVSNLMASVESTQIQIHQLVKQIDSNAILTKHFKIAAEKLDESEKKFNEAISNCRGNIDGENASLLAYWKSMAAECNVLKRFYQTELENMKASLNKAHELSNEKNFQLMLQECRHMRDQFENIAIEGTALMKQSKELDARLAKIEELAKQERESSALLKLEDNQRNIALRTKQMWDAAAMRAQKTQTLATQKTKLMNMVREREILAKERKALEQSFKVKMEERNEIAAEITSKHAELENTRKRTEQFEKDEKEKHELINTRRKEESGLLIRKIEIVRRKSCKFAHQVEMKKFAERLQQKRLIEELRTELQTLGEISAALKQAHKLEMNRTQRHYMRAERDLEIFDKSNEGDDEYKMKLTKRNIENYKCNVSDITAKTVLDQQLVEEEIEWLGWKIAFVKMVADASKSISESKHRAEVSRNLVNATEREINAKKAKYSEILKNAFDLLNEMTRKLDPETMMTSQPIDIIALGQPLEIFEQLGPVAKGRVHCGDNEELEVASAAANTWSKVAADSNLANCHLDFTTKIGNLACNGRGIDDKTVIIEAKRILAVHLKGVTREADETEEQFKFRKMLAKRVTDLQRLLENLEFLQNSMPSGQVLELKEKLCKEITQILTHQASCDLQLESSADLEYDD